MGVDRKSGEITSVGGASPPKHGSGEKTGTGDTADTGAATGGGNTRPQPKSRQSSGTSVRDMINNMNKGKNNTGGSSEKKGSSLPRGVQPPGGPSAVSDVARKFSTDNNQQRGGSSEPLCSSKKVSTASSSTEKSNSTLDPKRGGDSTKACTNRDDPRILKLDDEFDVLEV